MNDEKEIKPKPKKVTAEQAHGHFGLHPRRKFVLKRKFSNRKETISTWKTLLNKEGYF